MSKFNLNSMLNNTSKDVINNSTYKIEYVDITKINVSEKNFYNTDNIKELKESIELVGLRQNIEVWLKNGQYEIISGHRRHKACLELYNEGNEDFAKVPCRVLTDIDETTAEIQLIYGNSVNRELSDYEKMIQVSNLKRLLLKMQSQGEKITGRKRDIISNILDISKTQVGRLESINNNLNNELKEEFKDGSINMTTATELSKLDEDKQKVQLEKIKQGKKVTAKTLKSETDNNDLNENYVFENQIAFNDDVENENVSIMDTKVEDETKEDFKINESKDKIIILEKVIKKYKNRLENFAGRNDYDEENKLVIEALEHYIKQIK